MRFTQTKWRGGSGKGWGVSGKRAAGGSVPQSEPSGYCSTFTSRWRHIYGGGGQKKQSAEEGLCRGKIFVFFSFLAVFITSMAVWGKNKTKKKTTKTRGAKMSAGSRRQMLTQLPGGSFIKSMLGEQQTGGRRSAPASKEKKKRGEAQLGERRQRERWSWECRAIFFFSVGKRKKTKTVQTAEVVVQGKNENEMKCETLSSWDHNGASVLMEARMLHLLQCLWIGMKKPPPPFSPLKRPGIFREFFSRNRFKDEVEMSNADKGVITLDAPKFLSWKSGCSSASFSSEDAD